MVRSGQSFSLDSLSFFTSKPPAAHDNSLVHISLGSSHIPLYVEHQCVQWKVYLCWCVSLCLSPHCFWFPLISLKSYVFCHVLVFWMLAYGCHLFSPPALLPPCLLPISSLFACCSSCSTPPSTTAMSSPCVLRHCAQHWTCSSWLVSLLFFFTPLFFMYWCICPYSMPSLTVTQCCARLPTLVSAVSSLLIKLVILLRQLNHVTGKLCFIFDAFILAKNVFLKRVALKGASYRITTSNPFQCNCTFREHSPTNQLQCFPEGVTGEYNWLLYQQHEMVLCGGKNRPHLLVFTYLTGGDAHHFLILPNLHHIFSLFVYLFIFWLLFFHLWEQIYGHKHSGNQCACFVPSEILNWLHSLVIMTKLMTCRVEMSHGPRISSCLW